MAGLLGGGYMAIQGYVYVSFSLRFLAGSVLGYGETAREQVNGTARTWLVTVSIATAGGELEGTALVVAAMVSMYSPREARSPEVGKQAGIRVRGSHGSLGTQAGNR
jgi:hypothetical protein